MLNIHLLIFNAQEKRERLVSFEHRFQMCHLAFAHLNNNESLMSSQERQQTKVIISDAEYMSWKSAVKDMYVVEFCEMTDPSTKRYSIRRLKKCFFLSS